MAGIQDRRPRIVLVTRKTPLELLLESHGTIGQARFYLASRGEDIAYAEEVHERFIAGLAKVQAALPPDVRRTRVDRSALDRFLFAPDDIVVIVGQDGLVANVAKYLSGQVTIGINPNPERYDGILCPHAPSAMAEIMQWIEAGGRARFRVQRRVMALAEREDGQRLLALNEIFIGHQTHQSARYRIEASGRAERQSSSGVICSTGTGSTGWARSIAGQLHFENNLPQPEEQRLVWFVREPFPSVSTATGLSRGQLRMRDRLILHSEMETDGVMFADGIEKDRTEFLAGHRITVSIADQTLNLLLPVDDRRTPASAEGRAKRRLKHARSG